MNHKIYRAGLLPYVIKDGVVRFLFMKPSDPRFGGEMFQIAKGKIEDGETTQDAAIREASEELGLIPDNIKRIDLLGEFLGRTTIYTAEIIDESKFNPPHFETSETRWMSLTDFLQHGRKLHQYIVCIAYDTVQRTCV